MHLRALKTYWAQPTSQVEVDFQVYNRKSAMLLKMFFVLFGMLVNAVIGAPIPCKSCVHYFKDELG